MELLHIRWAVSVVLLNTTQTPLLDVSDYHQHPSLRCVGQGQEGKAEVMNRNTMMTLVPIS